MNFRGQSFSRVKLKNETGNFCLKQILGDLTVKHFWRANFIRDIESFIVKKNLWSNGFYLKSDYNVFSKFENCMENELYLSLVL